ncbi:Malectin/receptor-like protein kinase family protein [Perilla frutescens var. hirtella]|uniref:Malectin/receptor-like protein kinase family protein n=1 Tax=Perilla frutescens var. hirtella TaxID=608512 RepID=A0AAD4JAP8_PERFH|nr:Malectin/receptor-like protein kinase family protein [Perilla frutescens var. hirtella]
MQSYAHYFLLLIYIIPITTTTAATRAYTATDFILLNGGDSASNDTSGRSWDGDERSRYAPSNAAAVSSASVASYMHPSVFYVPYGAARVFHSPFTYTFPVLTGPKFLRLYFYPDIYSNFNTSQSFFSVTANAFTLLSNFSAYLCSKNSSQPSFVTSSKPTKRGSIDRGATVVSIKRLKTESRQDDKEFQTEIKMLSKVRNEHLVSLIGYCNDGQERILVYQYITQGTLADHLYKTNRHGRVNPPLPWEIRLKVSIGATRGLYYLHSRHRIIHRDVKSSNILLDENWVAKISDFGLSKIGPEDSIAHISTHVHGTFGNLDPEYFLTHKLTRKSDVYAFGVVLFEVLSGRPAVDIRLGEEQHSLAGWARYSIREGKVNRLIDQNLIEQISPACLKVFVGIAGRCLHTKPQGRPAMADVVMSLELALALQQTTDPTEQVDEEENSGRTYSDHSDGIISMDDISLPKGEPDKSFSEDNPSSSSRNRGSDQKSGKMKGKDNGFKQ